MMPPLAQAQAQPMPQQELAAPAAGAPQENAAAAIPSADSLPSPFSNVAAGDIPAISFPPEKPGEESGPLSMYAQQNLPTLLKAGLDVFESGDLYSVFFNPTRVSLEELKKADTRGELLDIAPSIQTERPKAGKAKAAATRTNHTAEAEAGPLAAEEAQAPAEVQQAQQAAPAAAQQAPAPRASGRLQNARIQALKPPAPGMPVNPIQQLAQRAI